MIFDKLNLPRDNGSTDFNDSARLAGRAGMMKKYYGAKPRACPKCKTIFKNPYTKFCSRKCYNLDKPEISKDDIKKYMRYDENTGNLYWKDHWHPVHRPQLIGKEASVMSKTGYKEVTFNYKKLRAHNVVWFLCKGKWPKHEIDHINRIKTDNRIENLRDVTHAENMRNFEHKNIKKLLPYIGVCLDSRSVKLGRNKIYIAYARHNGVIHKLGSHCSAVCAAIIRDDLVIKNKWDKKLNFPWRANAV